MEQRVVIGYYERPIRTYSDEDDKPRKGFLKVLFEEVDDEWHPINDFSYFDDQARIFQQDGYFECSVRHLKKLVKISAVPNSNERDGQTEYVTFKNNIAECDAMEVFSFIESELPDPMDLEVTLDSLPHTKYFFLLEGDVAYGPFRSELTDEAKKIIADSPEYSGPFKVRMQPAQPKDLGLNKIKASYIVTFNLSELKSAQPESILTADSTVYLTDRKALKKIDYQPHSYVTKNDVVRFLQSLSEKRLIPKPTASIIKRHLSERGTVFAPEGKSAIEQIVKEASEKPEHQSLLVDILAKDDDGKKLLESYVQSEKERYISQWDKEAQKKYQELSQKVKAIEEEYSKIKEEKSKAEQQLINYRNQADNVDSKESEAQLEKRKQETDNELNEKQKQLQSLKDEVREYQRYQGKKESLEELDKEIEIINNRKLRAEDALEEIKNQLNQSEISLQNKLRDYIPYVSSIIQAPITKKEALSAFEKTEAIHKEITTLDEAQQLTDVVIDSFAHHFSEDYSRNYSKSLIASILVAQYQSLITIFTGPPGLGKTSFVRLQQRIMCLQQRFIEVAVGRSWVSEREFVGFFNSLTDSFSPSNSGVYQFLKGISEDDQDNDVTSFLLLDEANLSPMEHYAACLLNIADSESDKSIQLSNQSIKIPNSFRIMATVNHDMTTEPLSERLLDRAPVIPFEPFIFGEAEYSSSQHSQPYTHATLASLFGNTSPLKSDEGIVEGELPESVTEVITIMDSVDPTRGKPFIISLRKREKLIDYINVLTGVLAACDKLTLKQANIHASDFAILYYLLPKINGSGEGVKRRLEDLLGVLDQHKLERSRTKLNDILVRGEQHLDTYNFFHY